MSEDSPSSSSLSQSASDNSDEVNETEPKLPILSHHRKRKGKQSRLPRKQRLVAGHAGEISQAIPTPRLTDLEGGDKELFIRRKAIARMAVVMEEHNRLQVQKEQRHKAIIEEKRKEDRRYQRLKAQKERKLEEDSRKRRKSYGIFRHPALFNRNGFIPHNEVEVA
jgi:hypothetical protein